MEDVRAARGPRPNRRRNALDAHLCRHRGRRDVGMPQRVRLGARRRGVPSAVDPRRRPRRTRAGTVSRVADKRRLGVRAQGVAVPTSTTPAPSRLRLDVRVTNRRMTTTCPMRHAVDARARWSVSRQSSALRQFSEPWAFELVDGARPGADFQITGRARRRASGGLAGPSVRWRAPCEVASSYTPRLGLVCGRGLPGQEECATPHRPVVRVNPIGRCAFVR
jgi:hypothetical protein